MELADNLVDNFDVMDLLSRLADRCVEIVDVAAAGLLLGSADGELRLLASSSEAVRVLELFATQTDEGPCIDCYRTGEPIVNFDLGDAAGRWPKFAPKAVEAGFLSVHALPMRLRGQTIGALNLFRAHEGALREIDVVAAQALADVATIAILQHRATSDAQALNEQLTQALSTRIVIEQAKGALAQQQNTSPGEAFELLRHEARSSRRRLVDVAAEVLERLGPPAG